MNHSASRREPPYARIAADIRSRIESGELRPGDRVPSTREITRRWGVAMATATKALTALRNEGLIRALPGVGSVVQGPPVPPRPRGPEQTETPRRPRPRGTETGLNHAAIVRAAVSVADAEGIQGLSMRRVATELGVSTMALYRYVSAKDDLVLLMADAVFTEHSLPDPPEDWRDGLELAARQHWEMFRRHPWMARVVSLPRPLLTPGTIAHTDWMVRLLTSRGHDPSTALYAVVSVTGYVMGMACQLGLDIEEENETGVSARDWWDSQEEHLSRFEESGRYAALFAAPDPPDIDIAFEFGLLRLLDGLRGFLEAETAGDPPRTTRSGPPR
ncbi:TetR/AcrR family transcriptional regulator C-terminal domain-containing protein [Thermobifida halotolerans]|uniref:TetR/AcrR family transcriptional regulator C-terminal domain-containing protein n=1 Tax=Thermobifida halotolerans TaxID=483545 RepID=A0AA97LWY5_9ACTN|nr:TetR/AcrR family transcriptional regulator C-terminal domain-containing protein [Thermobifida halotolerans]UOE19702.1 TetR/AcrR family transcriptional regulator C-terminal domain-containing protein [Thermobifida halotolerans]